MSLRIAHNVEAAGISRSLNVTAAKLATSMQRLSSGLRINSAADDAAGLGISERMRSQIRGLEQAGRNIQDGISLLQTIEGSLQEVHAILHRARDLAVQWNNDTNSFADKMGIRAEMFALSDEIASIEQRTEFNGIKLLQSSATQVTFQVGANNSDTISVTLADLFGPTVGNLVRPNTFFALPWQPADIAGFDLHIEDVSAARSKFGALINRLEHSYNVTQTTQENLMAAES
ncbi:MAG: flagellin FliC, partial [Thermoleophilia bacterium]|nr:flagellin FliC [Thermoleophilia bacterium]